MVLKLKRQSSFCGDKEKFFRKLYPDVFQVEKRQSLTCRHVYLCAVQVRIQTYMCAVLVELDRYPVPEKHVYVIL